MKKFIITVSAILLLGSAAHAQSPAIQYYNSSGQKVFVTPATPLPVTGGGGGGGGGGGAITAAIGAYSISSIPNGAITPLGNTTDPACSLTDATAEGLICLTKQENVLIKALGAPLQNGGSVTVSNFPATQPVSAAALPLPAGAATSANQAVINGDGGAQSHIMNFPATQPVSAAALPLPAGAATSANQAVINGDGGAQSHIMNFPATQPVSAAALPLPAGAATATGQTNTQAAAGSNAISPTGVQGVAGGVPIAVSGVNPSAVKTTLSTGSNGGLVPTQAIPTSTLVSLTASTIAPGPTASSTRLVEEFVSTAAAASPIYICLAGQSSTCSATVFDKVIPTGATTPVNPAPFGSPGAMYLFSTSAASVNITTWAAQ